MDAHFDLPASAWVVRWAMLIRPGGEVLDVVGLRQFFEIHTDLEAGVNSFSS